MTWRKLLPLLIIGAALVAYHNSFRGVFVFDDERLIVNNPTIRQLTPLGPVLTQTSRPMVQLSIALNYAAGGLNVWGYHAVNLTIHILAALTLFGILRRVSKNDWRALAVALLWTVHPLQTESVTYIIQRGESLMSLFYLLTLYCFLRSTDAKQPGRWQLAAILACGLGMATKPIMATAPLLVLLFDRALISPTFVTALRHRAQFYCGLAATWIILPIILANAPAEWKTTAGFDNQYATANDYLNTQPGGILHYIAKAVWPASLAFDYDWPVARTFPTIAIPALVILVLLGLTVWAYRKRPTWGILGVAFFLILAPTSSVIPIADIAVDHRLYLPLAALITLVILGIHQLGGKRTWITGGFVILAVPALTYATIQRNEVFHSSLALWGDTVAKRPENSRAHNNYANALSDFPDRLSEAITHYETAIRLRPDSVEAHYNLGKAFAKQGKITSAIEHYRRAIRSNPNHVDAHNNLGNLLVQQKQLSEAVALFSRAIQLQPTYAKSHNNLGIALVRQGAFDQAVTAYREAVRLDPGYSKAYYNLGLALTRQSKITEAIHALEQAARLDPQNAAIRKALTELRTRPAHPDEPDQSIDPAIAN